ncbi:MAG: peptidyl-tRNA hydrolase Pth2 [Nanoarchaeota archaeon]|nr:peptidyl-tRNA hydrolase Pth2 [Nanoarchaeota archaeon]
MAELKQVILMRTDLQMGKGKMIAQGAHASVQAVLESNKKLLLNWKRGGMKKVALKVNSQEELEELIEKALQDDLTALTIRDAGKTQVESGTMTCGAIGPAPEEKINKICGHLQLM